MDGCCDQTREYDGIEINTIGRMTGYDRDEPSTDDHRPLSRRLDRCDRVIQKESGDPNGGNMCSFSWATGTSRVRHNADYVPCAQIRFDL